MKITVLLAALLSASVAFAGPPAPKKTGIEGKDYVWNAQEGEKIEALQAQGRRQRMARKPMRSAAPATCPRVRGARMAPSRSSPASTPPC